MQNQSKELKASIAMLADARREHRKILNQIRISREEQRSHRKLLEMWTNLVRDLEDDVPEERAKRLNLEILVAERSLEKALRKPKTPWVAQEIQTHQLQLEKLRRDLRDEPVEIDWNQQFA